jgi:hypothetical protein
MSITATAMLIVAAGTDSAVSEDEKRCEWRNLGPKHRKRAKRSSHRSFDPSNPTTTKADRVYVLTGRYTLVLMQMNATRAESTVLVWADHRRWELKTQRRQSDPL